MRLGLTNEHGTPVDPVPFLVVVLTAFLITHAWGPLYLLALGVELLPAFVVLTALWLVIAGVAYDRLVRTVYPERPSVADGRLASLWYAVVSGFGITVLLALPFIL